MESTMLHMFRAGVTNCFFIGSGSAWALVDAGEPKKEGCILENMKRFGIATNALKLIVLTHGHFDHLGSAAAVRDATRARILVHELDRGMLEQWDSNLPRGFTRWGRLMAAMVKFLARRSPPRPAKADIVMQGERLSLGEHGIDAELLHTPGHTLGSLSVLLTDGEALVGDLAFNGSIFCRRPRCVLGQDLGQTLASWKRLLAQGMRTAYPGHGRPFPAEKLSDH